MSKKHTKTRLVWLTIAIGLVLAPLIAVAYTPDMMGEDFIAEIEEEEVVISTEESNKSVGNYDHLFRNYAEQYGVSYQLVRAISMCENTMQDKDLQAQLYYNFTRAELGIYEGEQEASYGLAMINIHYNPTISIENASDPDFAIEFLAKNLSNGNKSWWSCYTNGGYLKFL